MNSKTSLSLVLSIAGTFLVACGGGAPESSEPSEAQGPSAPAPSAAAVAAAEVKFNGLCASCHGTTGLGDGAILTPKPRNYTDLAWQASVTDEELAAIIVGGGLSVGKSALMPPSPDLADQPEVVAALIAKIRSFGK